MTRCCQDGESHITHAYGVAVAYGLMLELEASLGTRDNPRAGDRMQLATATEKVVVDVRFEYMANPHALGPSHVDVLIDVAEWIDERRNTGPLRDDQVGGVAETWFEELADSHAQPQAVPAQVREIRCAWRMSRRTRRGPVQPRGRARTSVRWRGAWAAPRSSVRRAPAPGPDRWPPGAWNVTPNVPKLAALLDCSALAETSVRDSTAKSTKPAAVPA